MWQLEMSVHDLIEKNRFLSSVQLFHNVTSDMFVSNKAKIKCKSRNSTKTHKNVLETEHFPAIKRNTKQSSVK